MISSSLSTPNGTPVVCGAKAASFAVIRPTEYVGILVECAYMTNPYDSVLYKSDSFARNVARGIADGILNYVNNSCN